MRTYCVYLTIYTGDELPPYYIGSSTVDRIKSGYYGSVQSKKYGETFKQQPNELFETIVIDTFDNRKCALEYELKLQKEHNVVKSELFMNMAYAQPNGFFGMDNKGENHPLYGKRGHKCSNRKWLDSPDYIHPMLGKKHSEKTKELMRKKAIGRKIPSEYLFKWRGKNNPMYGKKLSPERIEFLREINSGTNSSQAKKIKVEWIDGKCEYYGIIGDFCNKYKYPHHYMRKVKQFSMNDKYYYSKKYKLRIEDA